MLASVRKGIEGAKTQSLQRVKSLLYQLKHERKGDGGESGGIRVETACGVVFAISFFTSSYSPEGPINGFNGPINTSSFPPIAYSSY